MAWVRARALVSLATIAPAGCTAPEPKPARVINTSAAQPPQKAARPYMATIQARPPAMNQRGPRRSAATPKNGWARALPTLYSIRAMPTWELLSPRLLARRATSTVRLLFSMSTKKCEPEAAR